MREYGSGRGTVDSCYPIPWSQYFPTDPGLLDSIFRADLAEGRIRHPFDIDVVWPSSYSANTNKNL